MKILKRCIFFLSFVGLWKPQGWHGVKAVLYYIYQLSILISNHYLLLSTSLVIDFTTIDNSELFDSLTICLGLITVRQKMLSVITRRGEIKYVIDKLEKKPFAIRDQTEGVINDKFASLTSTTFIYYVITSAGGMFLYQLSCSNELDPPNTLLYNGWYPYNYTEPRKYWPTIALQLYAVHTATFGALLVDFLISALFFYMCGQLSILKYRFQVMIEQLRVITSDTSASEIEIQERLRIKEWVENHIDLIDLIKRINKLFSKVIMVSFMISSGILCTLAWLMSHTDAATMNFVGYTGFIIAMYYSIFQLCYSAHLLTAESANMPEEIYEANWPSLSKNVRRSVVIIMCKCYKPILITSSFFVVLSLESFTKIIKLAYTIYNVVA